MHATTSAKKQQEYMMKLQAKVDALQNRLGANEDAEEITSNHIKLLHRYNEAKDAAQILIGRVQELRELAVLKDTTIRQIHEDMDLLDEDAN
ncbi:hypothetical protein PAXRUDRAFT_14961 [Paxillus rubicundulus Ve08.2h10]|uniref:Swi5-domain-containing protein n=1 Tax=Paxillus rubicundulus Ve08.2h10 TaxID=930991 RepID=A0A0D0CH31_9AGAM|nr:hypothetical protein PAXRUDRAFT_14961 [Paxillus rubicundulus Ve08.2h10]